MTPADIAANLAEIRRRIAAAAERAGRAADTVRLLAVSKTFPPAAVQAALAAGQLDFGENKVQEGLQKRTDVAENRTRWHLIGHLQSNKARKAVEFDWIHSVDRLDLLQRLDRAAVEAGRAPLVLVQADLAREVTKHGAMESDVPALVDAALACKAVRLAGLMVLPPWSDDAETARPWFRALRELRDGLVRGGRPAAALGELSMGMSHDFEVAIEEGATIVRVGSAIFGARATPAEAPST